jgi:hypothetical protein
MNDDFDNDFQDFIDDLETSDKNDNACSIDNPDCEGCGS